MPILLKSLKQNPQPSMNSNRLSIPSFNLSQQAHYQRTKILPVTISKSNLNNWRKNFSTYALTKNRCSTPPDGVSQVRSENGT